MNYLAHACLAGDQPELLLGNLAGDFVKGRLDDAAGAPELRGGIWMHRRIDAFVDAHPAFAASRRRFAPERRRVAGIVVDLVYDHVLARDWAAYQPLPLADFAASVYALCAAHEARLPAGFVPVARRMAEHDWLTHYAHPDGLAAAIRGVARRLRGAGPLLAACQADVDAQLEPLAADFRALWPDALAYARLLRVAAPGMQPDIPPPSA